MIQIYRVENKKGETPDILFFYTCRNCAIKQKEKSFQITYDLYLSEKCPDEANGLDCEICEGNFAVDGRKIQKGDIKTNIFAIC